jgi:hypothetical protein
MNHVLVLTAVHCQPEVIEYTLGTWLETYDGSYRASVCISLSDDFESVCKRTDRILSLSPPVDIIRVPTLKDCGIFKYSAIHANCIRAMLEHCQDIPYTHVAILDHDLEFKKDFIKWGLTQDADWVCSLFDDRSHILDLDGKHWAPKCSIWHSLLSRELAQRITQFHSLIMPSVECGQVVYDTMAKAFEFATNNWGMDVRIHSEEDIEKVVKHLWSLSFEFGPQNDGYYDRLSLLKQKHESRFPNGIGHLLGKLS